MIRCNHVLRSTLHSANRSSLLLFAGGGARLSPRPGKSGVLQPIMPLDLPVKVRPWELTVANRQRIASLFPTAHRFGLGKLEPTAHRFAWCQS